VKLVYIAGPYSAKNFIGRLINIMRARKVAKILWSKGYAVICPHSNSALMDKYAPAENFYKGTLEMLKHCDYIVMLKGWSKSKGSRAELKYAYDSGISVIYWGTGDWRSDRV
jgi:nucleoside 2-deoxyribosyltransferase